MCYDFPRALAALAELVGTARTADARDAAVAGFCEVAAR